MEYEKTKDIAIEDTVKLGWVEARMDPMFKERLLNRLVSDYAAEAKERNRFNWKVGLGFGLAWLVVIALVVYGFWLPTSIDFLVMG